MRCFIGITLSNILKNKIYNFTKEKFNINGIKITSKDNLHITVKFLGDINDNTLNKIKNIDLSINNLGNANINNSNNSNNNNSSNLNSPISSIGAFPNYNNIKIIWVGAQELTNLFKETDEKLSFLGFKKEKNYIPHITICRVKYIKKENKKELIEKINKYKNINFGNLKVNKLTLFKSELSPKGAKYTILKEYPLM